MTIESFAIAKLSIKNERVRQFLAELLGSFIMAFAGIGAAHQLALQGGASTHGAIAGGLGLALGIFASAKASGGHLNPAVTVAHLILGRMGKGLIGNICGTLIYFAAQFLGMFTASAVIYGIYHTGESTLIPENPTPAQFQSMVCLYATCPTESYNNTMTSMFFDQVFSSAVLANTVLAVTDPFNANPPGMAPLLIGLAATTMGLCFGANAGGAINSARDFAPRIFASILYGEVAFTGIEGTNSEDFMWIPLLGPLVGGLLAGLMYLFFVCAHWPQHHTVRKPNGNAVRKSSVDDDSLKTKSNAL